MVEHLECESPQCTSKCTSWLIPSSSWFFSNHVKCTPFPKCFSQIYCKHFTSHAKLDARQVKYIVNPKSKANVWVGG